MSSTAMQARPRRKLLPESGDRGRLMRIALLAPLLGLLVAVVALTLYCRSLLVDAASGRAIAIGELPLFLVAGGFLLASASVVVMQSLRVAARVAGPEYRLTQALQRIRTGDLTFRVHLRRGDLLTGLAQECNELLDWLNAHPPVAARTGSDVVEVTGEVVDESPQELEEVGP